MLGLRSHYHDHRRKRSGLFALVKVQPSSDKSYLVLSVYVIVEVFCICSSRYQQYDSCTVLTFPVRFLNPERHLPTIRRVTKYCPPPQGCDKPSCSLVKNLSHFAFSGVAQGSRVKPNSALSSSNSLRGVAHSSELLVKSPLFNITFASNE